MSVEVPSEENAHEFVAKSKGGNHFSKSERELLINTYDDIMDINDDQIINAWSVWAVKVGLKVEFSFQLLCAKSRV